MSAFVFSRRGSRAAFTLIELLVVIGIVSLMISILLPSLSGARRNAQRVTCLANIRAMCVAQSAYATANDDLVVAANDGSYNVQGSWLSYLETSASTPLVRRCPADISPFFSNPLPGVIPAVNRMTSYAISDYASPTHVPIGHNPVVTMTQVRRSSDLIHFVELAETGSYAGADHIHVEDFYFFPLPSLSVSLISQQMPLGIHGGGVTWQSRLNYGFFDGHAETLPLKTAYTNPQKNQFDPLVIR